LSSRRLELSAYASLAEWSTIASFAVDAVERCCPAHSDLRRCSIGQSMISRCRWNRLRALRRAIKHCFEYRHKEQVWFTGDQ
jgi:hypothetical protein